VFIGFKEQDVKNGRVDVARGRVNEKRGGGEGIKGAPRRSRSKGGVDGKKINRPSYSSSLVARRPS